MYLVLPLSLCLDEKTISQKDLEKEKVDKTARMLNIYVLKYAEEIKVHCW